MGLSFFVIFLLQEIGGDLWLIGDNYRRKIDGGMTVGCMVGINIEIFLKIYTLKRYSFRHCRSIILWNKILSLAKLFISRFGLKIIRRRKDNGLVITPVSKVFNNVLLCIFLITFGTFIRFRLVDLLSWLSNRFKH